MEYLKLFWVWSAAMHMIHTLMRMRLRVQVSLSFRALSHSGNHERLAHKWYLLVYCCLQSTSPSLPHFICARACLAAASSCPKIKTNILRKSMNWASDFHTQAIQTRGAFSRICCSMNFFFEWWMKMGSLTSWPVSFHVSLRIQVRAAQQNTISNVRINTHILTTRKSTM